MEEMEKKVAKGILIGFKTKEIVEVETNEDGYVDLDELYNKIGCDLVTVVEFEENIVAWVDDVGLLKSDNFVQKVSYMGFDIQLAGNILFLGTTEEGDSVGLTELELEHMMSSLSTELVGFVR